MTFYGIGATIKRKTGFEPATLALARRYSTTEPLAHGVLLSSSKEYYNP